METQSRSDTFLDLFEGFKLGSLGAHHSFAQDPVDTPKKAKTKKEPAPPVIVNISRYVLKGSDGFQGWIGNARWMEEHVGVGSIECMLGARQTGKNYENWALAVDITFFPGPDAVIPEVIKGGDTLRYIKILSDKKETKAQFNVLRKEVKKEGLKALGFTLKNIGKTVSGWKKVSMAV